ncbi:YoaK family protein [Gordonia sp. NPDC003424]
MASAVLMTAVAGYIDAFLFLRHQVFGFAQTGNVIFMAVGLVKGGDWVKYVWPLLAYLAGLVAAQLLRTFAPELPTRAIGAAMGFQVVVFAALACLPSSAPAAMFVVPLSFVGGIRLELFRSAPGISFVSIATTGNLMRFVAAMSDFARNRSAVELRAAAGTGIVVIAFLLGALCGAGASQAMGPALWGAVILEGASLIVFFAQTRRGAPPSNIRT